MDFEITFFYAGHYWDNQPIPEHSHWGTELVYTARGKCVTRFRDDTFLTTRAGMVCITPPELMHQQKNLTADCETYYAVMQVNGRRFRTDLRTIDVSDDPLIGRWFQDLLELWNNHTHEAANALLAALWLRLEACEMGQKNLLNCHPGLRRALDLLENHYMEPLDVSTLAQAAGLSRSHLAALFRQRFQTGINTYLTSIRMMHARRLLLNPYYHVAEIGVLCGYPDSNYFTRNFHRFHGVTPLEYRRNPSISSRLPEGKGGGMEPVGLHREADQNPGGGE